MTPAPHSEYTVTKEDLDKLLAVRCKPNSHLDVWDWVKYIKKHRSRPATAPEHTIRTTSELPKFIPPLPEGDTTDLKVWKEYWKQHDAAIARAATLAERQRWMDVLNRGKSALKELDEDGMRSFHSQGKLDVIEWIEQESLRGGATQQGGSER